MPYLITTRTPPTRGAMACCSSTIGAGTCGHMLAQSRRAVATIEDAREVTSSVIGDVYCRTGDALDAEWCAFLDAELPGTVGPLPDGTVITVESIGWDAIRDAIGRPTMTVCAFNADNRAAILAAFNAAQ